MYFNSQPSFNLETTAKLTFSKLAERFTGRFQWQEKNITTHYNRSRQLINKFKTDPLLRNNTLLNTTLSSVLLSTDMHQRLADEVLCFTRFKSSLNFKVTTVISL